MKQCSIMSETANVVIIASQPGSQTFIVLSKPHSKIPC